MRRSRLTATLLAAVWVPYVAFCCVVSPVAEASGTKPKCHVMAEISRASADADAGARPGDADGGLPAQTCCDLTGKANMTLDKGVPFDPAPIAVAAAKPPAPGAAAASRPARAVVTVVAHAHGPPLYLSNASLLI